MWTAIAVVIVGLVALGLFTPIELVIHCDRAPEFRCRLGFAWLFGMVRKKIEPAPEEAEEAMEAAEPARRRKKRRRRRRKARRRSHILAMLTTRGFLPGTVRLVRRLAHAFRVRDVFIWLRAGFEDPADTGLMCAWMMPAAAWLQARHPGHWDVAPVFSAPTLRFAVRGRLVVTPGRLVWPVVAFGLSPRTIRGFIALRTGRSG